MKKKIKNKLNQLKEDKRIICEDIFIFVLSLIITLFIVQFLIITTEIFDLGVNEQEACYKCNCNK